MSWIGSPSTVKYLETIKEPLQQLAKKIEYKLRVIGAEFNLPDVQVEGLPWSEATEVENIANADIGIMPLLDSPWERGKCGYKLIQYMACSLPVIASPIGVNNEIVEDGINGYLANNALQWLEQLESLLLDANLRQQMGLKGREKVE
ncbi:glycosyltransferase family 4 protein [Moraxella sp. DOX410]|nr:glycosyltransferase family 4 protein [Moraxella sp. DOX410]WNP28407.1 glycosyltransferase family 4 protein [Moraxella sp. DOX410]